MRRDEEMDAWSACGGHGVPEVCVVQEVCAYRGRPRVRSSSVAGLFSSSTPPNAGATG